MARKINTNFILIVTLIVGFCMVGAGGVWYYKKKHKDPKALLAIAQAAEAQGDLTVASQHYLGAGQLMRDPKLMVKAGDLVNQLVYEDDGNLGKAQGCWALAVATDPAYLPALERQLTSWQEVLAVERDKPSPRIYDNIREVADKIIKVDPKHLAARAAGPIAVIDAWMHRIETDQDSINTAVQKLTELQKDDPKNADIPFYIAAAYATEAEKLNREGKTADGAKRNADAISVMEEALKANDSNAKLHYRMAQVYLSQSVPATDEAKRKEKEERVRGEAIKAGELVKPTDPEYDDIKILAATMIAQPILPKDANPAEVAKAREEASAAAEKIYRDMLKERPGDMAARVRLGEMLGTQPDHRDEAIELLKSLPAPSMELRTGPRGLLLKGLEAQALSSLTNMRLDKLFSSNNKSQQDAILPEIEAGFQKLEAKAPDNPLVLRIKAKLQIAKGQTTDALSTLSQAIARIDARNPVRFELMYLSAKCYLATNQTGSAKAYLQQIVNAFPKYDQARLLLTETQLREYNFTDAETNLKELEKNMPGSMDVIRMRVAMLQQQKKTDEAKALYAKLPEDSRNRQLDKATIAMLMSMNDEAKRLLETVSSANPKDIDAALMLSGFHSRNKDTAAAMAVIEKSLVTNPNNSYLMLERARLAGSSPQELRDIRLKEAEKIADPLSRELAMLDLTRSDPDENVPLRHLQAAEKIDPKDQRVLTAMFEYHLAKRNFDQAAPYAERLGEMNADKVRGTLFRWRLAMGRAGAESDAAKRNAYLVKAEDLATQLTHDFPEFAQSWICLGQAMQALGRSEDAIPHFMSAKEKQPQNPDPYRGLIECYYELKRTTDAGKIIAEAVNTLRGMPQFKEVQLQHEMQYGEPEKVVADREQAVKDDPNSPQVLMSLAQVYASVARAKRAKPETEKEKAQWLEKSKTALAKGAEQFPNELSFTVTYGSICQLLKQDAQGEKLWQATLAREQWKDNPIALASFAEFYARSKRPADAEKLLRDYLATPAGKNNPEITMRVAELLVIQKKVPDAIALLDTIPDNPALQAKKVELLISQNKMQEAEKIITTLQQQKKSPELSSALAYVYLNSERPQQALDLANQILAEHPQMASALLYRAMATLRLPKPSLDAVVSDLVQVRELAPQNIQARYLLADTLVRSGDVQSSIKEYEGIIRMSPAQKGARIRLMDLYSNLNPPRWLDAERVARDGENSPELVNDPEFLAAEGQLSSRRGDTDRAVRAMNQALKLQPQNPVLIQAYYGVLINGKQYQQLLTESAKLPAELKDTWWAHSLRGAAQCKLGEREAGIQEFVTALNVAFKDKNEAVAETIINQMVESASADSALKVVSKLPQASEPRWMMTVAWLQWRKNDLASARKTMDQVLANPDKLSPEQHVSALEFAGSIYMQTPDADATKSRDYYLQVLKLKPEDYRIYNNLACNTSVSPSDALEYSRKAFELMQKTHSFEPLVADTYGWSLVQSGDERNLDMGLDVLLDAWKSGEIVDVAYHLGEAYLKKNNAAEADKYLTRAQTLYNDAVKDNKIVDVTLQQSILAAQARADKLKGRKGS